MDRQIRVVGVTICAVINDIVQWIMKNGNHDVKLQRGFEDRQLKTLFIVVDELAELRDTDNVNCHFQISAIGLPDKYPIDILEVVYKDSDPYQKGGIYFRFEGGEIPITLNNPPMLVVEPDGMLALMLTIVKANGDLINLIKQSKAGGRREIKRSGR